MCAREGRQALVRGCDKFGNVRRRPAAQGNDAGRQREQVLDLMLHLPEQQILSLLRPLAFGDVTGDFRRAYDGASAVSDWRNGQGNVDTATVFALPNCLVLVDPLAAADALEDLWLLIVAIWRNEKGGLLADRFFSGVAEEPLRATVPARDDAVEVLRKNRIVGRFMIAARRCRASSSRFCSAMSTITQTAPTRCPLSL